MGYTPPQLYVNKIAGGWSMYPPNTLATEDLRIYANPVQASAGTHYIEILGGDSISISSLGDLILKGTGATVMKLSYSTPDCIWESTIVDKNIFLKTTGTGVVKFGTYTAGAATDSTGYISILDAAGNARKLMVQA